MRAFRSGRCRRGLLLELFHLKVQAWVSTLALKLRRGEIAPYTLNAVMPKQTQVPYTQLLGSLKDFAKVVSVPVAAELYLAAIELYQAAATFRAPVTNPEEFKVLVGTTLVALADRPESRGAIALKSLVSHDPTLYAPLLARVMAFNNVFRVRESEPRLAAFFSPEGVDEVLLEACATAPFRAETLDFDIPELLKIAEGKRADPSVSSSAPAS
jgi:hypothetical protein